MKDDAVILFTRIPLPGKTKTRLQPLLSGEACCRLQRAFLRDIFRALQRAPDWDLLVCHGQEGDPAELRALLPGAPLLFPQQGRELGEQMHRAIAQVLGMGYRRCLLVGSDIPLLRPEGISAAFRLLERHDMVLCPAEDGGYWLVGMSRPCPEVFRVEYGGSTVFAQTMAAAEQAGLTCAVGEETMDVDAPEDLFRLAKRLAQDKTAACAETRRVLGELFQEEADCEFH